MTGKPGTTAILAPVDGSRFSEDSLPLAASVARALGADIHLVRVHEVIVSPPIGDIIVVQPIDPRIDADMRKAQSEELARTAAALRTASGRPVHPALLDGPVSSALREHASAVGAELIVMTTHGRGGIARTLLGSVATDLVRGGGPPVLLIRPREGHPPPVPTGFDHVLIPLDGSALAESVITPALRLLRPHGTATLFRAVAPVTVDMSPNVMPLVFSDPHLLDEEVAGARAYLGRVAALLRARGVTVLADTVAHPSAPVAIAEEVQARAPHFIAMATHGRGGMARLLMGSVADTVLRHVDVPVLLFRPPST